MAVFVGGGILCCCTYQEDQEQSQSFDWSMGVFNFERRIYVVLSGNTVFLYGNMGTDISRPRFACNYNLVHLVAI